jgi:hypothetical protein
MSREEKIARLDALLKEGKTEEVISEIQDEFTTIYCPVSVAKIDNDDDWFEAEYPSDYRSELFALKGMAFYRRKEFDIARANFGMSLSINAQNERAIYGMAYLAAYVDRDSSKVREWMEKLPESAAKNNARVIIARSDEYLSDVGVCDAECEVEEILHGWVGLNPQDPLNTANILHNAARFYMEIPEDVEGGKYKQQDLYKALAYLQMAIGLYGTGNMNLHHRAAANYWLSVAQEKLLGPAAAIPFACESLHLWVRQLVLDPDNPHYQKSYTGSREQIAELCYKMGEEISQRGPGAGNYVFDLIKAADDALAVTRLQFLTS